MSSAAAIARSEALPVPALPKRRLSDLRLRFGLILGVAMAPLLAFSVWQSTMDFREDIRERAQIIETSAQFSVDGLMSTISDAFTQLDVLRGTVRATGCATDFRAVLQANSEIDHLVLADAGGNFVCSVTDVDSRRQAFDLAKTLTPDTPSHTEIRRPAPGQDAPSVLVLSLGNFDDAGQLDRIFIAAINLSRLDGLARDNRLAQEADVAVLSRDGQALYSSSPRFPLIESTSLAAFKTDRQRLRLRDADLNRREVTLLRTDLPDVITAISAPENTLLSGRTARALAPALLPLLAWLFAFAAIWLAADRLILSHLRQMRGAALHFASGDMATRVGELGDAPDQIQQLGRTFDLMATRISEREASLQAGIEEKSVLLREIHHRVKNNLQIIISLLNMQQRELEDPRGREAIEDARNRVGAIALVHRSLYESDDLSDVDMQPFLDQLVGDLFRSLEGRDRGIALSTELEDAEFDSNMAIPIALFVVETLSNAIKHGVPEGGDIHVRFAQDDTTDTRTISVLDSGSGPGEDAESSTGWRLMRGFARQVGGTFETDTREDGFEVRLVF